MRTSRLGLALKAILLTTLAIVAVGSLAYGVITGWRDSADLERRAEEASMFKAAKDPYQDQEDMTYPPSALPFFAIAVPTSSKELRRGLWIGLNLTALIAISVGILMRWGSQWPDWIRASFALAIVSSKPCRGGMALGQFHLLPLAFLVGAEAFSTRYVLSGFFVGLALIKPTMVAPYLIFMAIRRRWGALVVAGLVQISLFAVSAWQLQLSPLFLTQEWFRNARAQSAQGTIDVPSLMLRIWPPTDLSPTSVSLVVLAIFAGGLLLLRRRSDLGLFALSMYVATVFTYHRHYDLVLLVPALAYLIDRSLRSANVFLAGAAGMMTLLLIIPSSSRLLGRWEMTYDRVFAVLSYVVLIVLIGVIALEPKAEGESGPRETGPGPG